MVRNHNAFSSLSSLVTLKISAILTFGHTEKPFLLHDFLRSR